MNLYLLKQEVNYAYDTYDSCVVCAPNEEVAKSIHPTGAVEWYKGLLHSTGDKNKDYRYKRLLETWVNDLSDIEIHFVGTALSSAEICVVCASFNAG